MQEKGLDYYELITICYYIRTWVQYDCPRPNTCNSIYQLYFIVNYQMLHLFKAVNCQKANIHTKSKILIIMSRKFEIKYIMEKKLYNYVITTQS